MSVGRWTGNLTHLCYTNITDFNNTHDIVIGPWCGEKDVRSQVGFILPLIDEMTWPLWLR